MNDLIKFFENRNRDIAAYEASNPGTICSRLSTDPQFWLERGVTTPDEFIRWDLETCAYYMVADAYSKSYARSFNFKDYSNDELEQLMEDCSIMIENELAAEKAFKEEEDLKATVEATMLGVDRSTYDRWIQQAEIF